MAKRIAPDKWRHFYAGIAMGLILQIISGILFPSLFTAVIVTLLIVTVISFGFELFSLVTGIGYYDFMDAIATIIGGIAGMGLVFIFQVL